ncbi:hypothetical protein Tco_1220079 [Tanacetum coccineum]
MKNNRMWLQLNNKYFDDRLELGSHKDKPKEINDDDDDEKKYDKKDDDDNDDDDDHDDHAELTVSVTPTLAASSQGRSKPISRRYTHILESIKRMCRRQGFMMQHMQTKFVTNDHFQDTLKKVNESLKDIVPNLATSATNDIIKDNLPRLVTDAVKKERESS